MTVLCGCVMLQSLVCDIDPSFLNQSTGLYWRREALGTTEPNKIKPLNSDPILPAIKLIAYRK